MPPRQAATSQTEPYEETVLAQRELRAQGCDFVMVISHLGVDDTYPYPTTQLAKDVPNLDLIADGHSHHPLPEGIRVGNVLVTQPADRLGSFVRIDAVQDDQGVRTISCRLITLEWCRSHLEPDAEVQKILDEESSKVSKATTVYCQTPVLLDGGRPQIRQKETHQGDIVCDALLYVSDADIAICGGGAIRAGIPQGPISNFDVASVFANGGDLGLFRCTGNWILRQMENSLASYPTQTPSFLQIGGLWLTFSPQAEPGSRIRSAKLTDGTSLEPDQTYLVAKEVGMMGPHSHGHQQDAPGCTKLKDLGTLAEAFTGYLESGRAVFYEAPAGRIQPTP